jgi:hypothetical protein
MSLLQALLLQVMDLPSALAPIRYIHKINFVTLY